MFPIAQLTNQGLSIRVFKVHKICDG